MRKNKGIVIELTALLDVIFIMLFWMMINVQEGSTKVREDADSRIAQAEAEVVQVREESEEKLENMRKQADSEIKKAQDRADNLNRDAAANQRALENFGKGLMLTINLKYSPGGELIVTNGDTELARTAVTSESDVYSAISEALTKAGIAAEDVVLCAFVYDGSRALFRDVSDITDAVGRLGKSYKNFYCTFINTAR
ncbi:MAG: hypothetical protein K6F71_14970 [Ruminococcus sp.]|uniref:hypothetical protein n=1 Tax=Ruminococcus sp. TaxID=41978 RepID=UPI0025E01A24|nr:hypothetical protein [Ruminococcus sp.]MCR5542108.1 hypothetical protein [Ruminococcus sp.]